MPPNVHLALPAADSKEALRSELTGDPFTELGEVHPGVFSFCVQGAASGALPHLAFARQLLPNARAVGAKSITEWANALVAAVAGVLPDQQLWSLHVYAIQQPREGTRMGARAWHSRSHAAQHRRAGTRLLESADRRLSSSAGPPLKSVGTPQQDEGAPVGAGESRCRLIRSGALQLLQKRRRHLARYLRQEAFVFDESESLVQLALTSPERGFMSIAPAPEPFLQRHVLSCFSGGAVAPSVDKRAPSRAFGKLLEAEARMGRRISAGDTCVDLGASPGSWTYVAARRSAKVTAVDRSELSAELMQDRHVRFQRGDAFRFEPDVPVDWLLCDVIAAPERAAELLLHWLRQRWCRHFVVTLKVDEAGSPAVLTRLKRELPSLTSELWLLRLCANKKEVTAFGTIVAP